MLRPTILLVGDTRRREFREADAALERAGDVARAADVEAALGVLEEGRVAPDVIVVAQAQPGQFAPEAVDRLRRLAPLARVLGLLGSWCEGESRTGEPWPAAIRLYWHQWLPQCDRELGRLLDGRGSSWALPATATDDERLLAQSVDPAPRRQGLIALCVRRFEMHDWFATACRRQGYSTVWLRPGEPIRVDGVRSAVFDGTDCGPDEVVQIEHLSAELRPAAILALLDFPRIEDHDRALAAGAAAVLSKPLLLDDLFWQLDRM
jgi:CheY-like chemotaxis protein